MAELGPVTCAGCGLLCDDVLIERSGEDLRLDPRCDLGAEWFSRRSRRMADAPAATIRGRPSDVESALSHAAELLRAARRPLLYGFDGATVNDARAAVALADRLGALIGAGGPVAVWPGAPAMALRGACTATLGEIRDRSRVVVIWREDPEITHPRLLDRLGFGDSSRAAIEDRALVVVDDRDSATARRADVWLRLPPERDLEALTALNVLQRKLELRAPDLEPELGELLSRIDAVPHAAFVYGPALSAGAGGQRRALALHELVRELCQDRHVVTLELPAAAGTRSAQEVLAWQTGYADSVDLASGHPELVTATGSPPTCESIDVSLCIEGAAGALSDSATAIALSSLPVAGVEVSIRTAAAGVAASGIAHRLDGIPLELQAPLPDDAPTAATVLARLLEEIER